ncbi:hypothetical protein L9F63_014898, partial [Diploptera punctata]
MNALKNYFSFKLDNFVTAISPFYFVSKLLGLAPLVLFKNSSRIRNCVYKMLIILNTLYSLIIASFIVCLCGYHFYYFKGNVYPYTSPNTTISDVSSKLLLYGTPLTCILTSVIYRKTLTDILQGLHNASQKIITNDSLYVKIFFICVFEIILANFLIFGLYGLIILTWGMTPFKFFYFETFVHVSALVVDFQFVSIVTFIRYLYKTINKRLYSSIDNQYKIYVNEFTFYKKLTSEEIYKLKNVYKDLYEIVQLNNGYFRWHIVLETTSTFMQLVSTNLNWVIVIKAYLDTTDRKELYGFRIISMGCWVLFYMSNIFSMGISGHLCRKEANKTLTLIHKILLNRSLIPRLSKELESFALFASTRKVQVTNGIFVIDMTLFHSVLAASIVYLTILLQ